MIIKERKALNFQKRWLEVDKEFLMEKLKEYWIKYRFLNEIRKLVDFKGKKILDIGCGGPSSVLNLIKGERYGVDPLIGYLLKIYELNKEIHWQKTYGERLPFEDEFFDVVVSSNALDHVENVKDAFSEVKRVLKPRGKIVLTVDIFKRRFKRDERHPYTFIEDDVLALLKEFKIIFKKTSERNASFYRFLKGEDVKDSGPESYFLKKEDAENMLGELVVIAEKN